MAWEVFRNRKKCSHWINTWYFGSHYLLPRIKKICICFWVTSESNSKKQAQISKALLLGSLIQEFFAAAIICDIREGAEAPSLWTLLRKHGTQNPFSTTNLSCFRLLSLLCSSIAGAQCQGHRGCTGLTSVTSILQRLRHFYSWTCNASEWNLCWGEANSQKSQTKSQKPTSPGWFAFTPPITTTSTRLRHLDRIKNNNKNENQVWKPLLSLPGERPEQGEPLNLNFLL